MNTINMLDYHAAHAPAVPEWFTADLPTPKSHPGQFHNWVRFGQKLTQEEFALTDKYSIGEDWQDDDAPTELVKKWESLWEDWQEAEKQYQLEMNHYHISKLVQWRVFYAQKMLEITVPIANSVDGSMLRTSLDYAIQEGQTIILTGEQLKGGAV